MKGEESDNESVESGSCTCSDYDPDCSWFYDSRTLETSYMRFYIYGISNKNNIINKNKPLINRREEARNNTNNKIDEITIDNNLKSNSKRKNVIKITRRSPYRNSGAIKDDHINKSKMLNKTEYLMKNNKNDSMELTLDNNTNNEDNSSNNNNNNNNNNNERKVHRTYMPKKYLMGNYSIPSFKEPEFSIDKNDFFQENIDDDFEQKLTEPSDKFDKFFMGDNFMTHAQRSPITTKGRFYKRRENRVEYKTEQKPKIQKINVDINRAFDSPNKNYNNSFSNINFFNEDNKDELFSSSSNSNYKNRNVQTRGRTIKEKIVKEIKNITLQPGQSIKPKIITKRKLKPVTNIIKNDDGSQNIITENTTLTTIIINEFIDSSKIYQDDYPLDVQLVKQHITKIYKIETENNTCLPK